MTNCPNCGAPVKEYECEYCGTVFPDVQQDLCHLTIDTKMLAARICMNALYSDAIKAMRAYSGEV